MLQVEFKIFEVAMFVLFIWELYRFVKGRFED
jgi:F0F1-type ATP synthase membrane subunit b/b'